MKIWLCIIAVVLVGTVHTSLAAEHADGSVKTVADNASIETKASGTVIGSVKTVAGDVSIIRNNKVLKAKADTLLFVQDTITTGRDGAVGVVFKDNGVLSIGPQSNVTMNDFVFNPELSQFSMITDILKGSCVYLGGVIAKLKPVAVQFMTPSATIGIRGTRFAVSVGYDWKLQP